VAAKLETTRQYADYIDFLLLNQGFLELNNKGMGDQELDPLETQRFSMMLSKAFWYFASMHFQYRMGAMSADEWVQSESTVERYCSSPAVRRWWRDSRQVYGHEFGGYVDRMVDRAEGVGRRWDTLGPVAPQRAGDGQGT
jgi:hypothetical protein